jgi:hypothetical protein
MNRKHDGRFFGFTVFLTVMASALVMISLAACPADGFDDVEQIAAVVADPPAGAVGSGQQITLSCATSGVTIYYTLDDSTPSSANGTLYGDASKPVLTILPVTLKAIAVKSDMADSPVFEAGYYMAGTVAAPSASPGTGDVILGKPITLSCAIPGAEIYYTIDGSAPSKTTGTLYVDTGKPLTFAGTLKAIAVKDGMDDSEVLEVTYTEYAVPAWTAAVVEGFYNDYVFCTAHGDGKFVAGTYASILNYSADGGGTWNLGAYPLFTGPLSIYGIAFGNNTFVASGVYGNIAFASSSTITTWTPVTTSNFPQTNADTNFGIIYSVAYGNGKFIAVGVDGKIVYASDTNLQSWTLVGDSTFGTSIIKSITYGKGKFVAVSVDGKIAHSTDGASWTPVADSTFNGTTINSIAWGEDIFVAAGAGGKMAWSEDGVTWTAVADSSFAGAEISGICYGDEQFIAVGAYNTTSSKAGFAGSPDGKNWVSIDIPNYLVDTYSVAFGNDKFVAGGAYGVIGCSATE